MAPTLFSPPLNTSPHSTVIILDKADDPLGAGVTLVVARETNAQRFDLIVRGAVGVGLVAYGFLRYGLWRQRVKAIPVWTLFGQVFWSLATSVHGMAASQWPLQLPSPLASPQSEAQTVWPCFYAIRFKATIMTPAINLLKKLKIPHKLYPYECEAHDDFGKHAATQLGLPEAQVFKTLVAHHDKQAVVAIVPSSGMCSLKQLAKATGLKKVEMMKPAEAEKLTGYKVGGISPLAQKKLLPTVLDESALQFDEILVSGGKRGLSVGVAPQDMLTLMKWIAAPIGEE